MNSIIKQEQYLDSWYDWEVIGENWKMDISPEAMVAINGGFGTSKGIPNMTGELQWNEAKLVFEIGNLKIRRSRKVKFYKQAALFEITDLDDETALPKRVIMRDSKLKQLYLNNDVYLLDNSNAPIYNANEKFGLDLDLQSVIDYIYFFFYNVKGRHGHFYPVASFNQIQPLINISIGNLVNKTYEFTAVEEDLPDLGSRNYTLTAFAQETDGQNETPHPQSFTVDDMLIIFKDSIFNSTVNIDAKNGMITLSNEKLEYESHTKTYEQ